MLQAGKNRKVKVKIVWHVRQHVNSREQPKNVKTNTNCPNLIT